MIQVYNSLAKILKSKSSENREFVLLTSLLAKPDLNRYKAIYIPYLSQFMGTFIFVTEELLMCLIIGGCPHLAGGVK